MVPLQRCLVDSMIVYFPCRRNNSDCERVCSCGTEVVVEALLVLDASARARWTPRGREFATAQSGEQKGWGCTVIEDKSAAVQRVQYWPSTYARQDVGCMQHVEAGSAWMPWAVLPPWSTGRARQAALRHQRCKVDARVGDWISQLAGLIDERPMSFLCLVRRYRVQGLLGGLIEEPASLGTWKSSDCVQSFLPLARTGRDGCTCLRNNHPAIRFARLIVLF